MRTDSCERHFLRKRVNVAVIGTVVLLSAVVTVSEMSNTMAQQPRPQADDSGNSRSANSGESNSQYDGTSRISRFRRIECPRDEPHQFDGIDQVDFSADGKTLFIAAHRVGDLSLLGRKPTTYWIEQWDVMEWKKLATLPNLAAPFSIVDDQTLVALPAKSAQDGPPFGRIGSIAIYDLKSRAITRQFDVETGYVCRLACAPDGQSVVACSRADAKKPTRWVDGRVDKWSIDGRLQWQHHWDTGRVSLVDWSPDGRLVLGAGTDGVSTWNADSGAIVWEHDDHPNGIESLAWTDDGRHVVTASYCNPSSDTGLFGRLYSVVKVRNTTDGKPIRSINLYHNGVVLPLDLDIAPGGRSIAVALGSYNRGQKWGEVRIVDMETGETTATLLKDHEQPVTTVAWSPHGKFIAAGSADGRVNVWRIEDDDQKVIDTPPAQLPDWSNVGNNFGAGLADYIGKAIERDLREKLKLSSEMEWDLFRRLDDVLPDFPNDAGKYVALIHLLLPSDNSRRSKTIVVNTADDRSVFLRFTRSYGLVSRPTAIVGFVAPTSDSHIVSGETSLTWQNDRWVEVERDTIEETIE